jgi:Domain of unknown function (DUF4249)
MQNSGNYTGNDKIMMNHKTLFLLLVAFVEWGLFSCNPDVEIERIATDKLVAVSSFISPQDSVVSVNVYRGKALGEIARSDNVIVTNAKVSMTDGTKSYDLKYNSKSSRYEIDNTILKVTALKTYSLQVITADGIVLKASCQVPATPSGLIIKGYRSGNNYVYGFDWPNDALIRYFIYNTELVDVKFTPKLGATLGPSVGFSFGLPIYDSNNNKQKNIENTVFNAYLADKVSIQIKFSSLDQNLYNYLKTNSEAYIWSANSSEFVPNLKEPQPVFTNIVGGVGIFGAYSQTLKTVVIL